MSQRLLSFTIPAIGGDYHPIALQGYEALNAPYQFKLTLYTQPRPASAYLGQTASLTLHYPAVTYPVYITRSETENGLQSGWQKVVLTLHSPLYRLHDTPFSKTYTPTPAQTLAEHLETLLRAQALPVRFKLFHSYPPVPYCVRYQESTLAYIQRLVQTAQWYYYHDPESPEATLIITDAVTLQGPSERLRLHYQPADERPAITEAKYHTFSPGRSIPPLTVYELHGSEARLRPGAHFNLTLPDLPELQGIGYAINHEAYDDPPFQRSVEASPVYRQTALTVPITQSLPAIVYAPSASPVYPFNPLTSRRAVIPRISHTRSATLPHDHNRANTVKIALEWEPNVFDSECLPAPQLSLLAGPAFGWHHLPRPGDKVAVQFIDEEPHRPVIVGSYPQLSLGLSPAITGLFTTAHQLTWNDHPATAATQLSANGNIRFTTLGQVTVQSETTLRESAEEEYHLYSAEGLSSTTQRQTVFHCQESQGLLSETGILFHSSSIRIEADLPTTESVPVQPVNPPRLPFNQASSPSGPHWIQAHCIGAKAGTPWRLKHTQGMQAQGMVDAQGKTPKITGLPPGTVSIVFGNREALLQQLSQHRAHLKQHLEAILTQTRAAAARERGKYYTLPGWEEQFIYNAAVLGTLLQSTADTAGRVSVHLLKETMHGVVLLFQQMMKQQEIDDESQTALFSGDAHQVQAAQQKAESNNQAVLAVLDRHFLEPLRRALACLRLLCSDPDTRELLVQFARDYYYSSTPLMLAKAIGQVVGGMVPGLLVALILKEPSLLAPSAKAAFSEVNAAARECEVIADTLTQLEDTAEIQDASVDSVHYAAIRPAAVDIGAQHEATITTLFPKNHEQMLEHPAGKQYNLPKKEMKNFSGTVTAKTLPKGTVLYRFVEENVNNGVVVNGRYWSYELPDNEAQWRSGWAVKGWNKDGFFVRHVVGEEGLNVWEGVTATQNYEDEGFKDWIQLGGKTQVFAPLGHKEIPKDLPRKRSLWRID